MPSVSDLASPAVAVVILNYNGLADTEKCLESLRAIRYPRLSVIVVDNGSDADPTDVVSKTFPHATLIKTGENLGYAGGNNVEVSVTYPYEPVFGPSLRTFGAGSGSVPTAYNMRIDVTMRAI